LAGVTRPVTPFVTLLSPKKTRFFLAYWQSIDFFKKIKQHRREKTILQYEAEANASSCT